MKTRTKLVTSMATLFCGLALSVPGTAAAAPGISIDAAKLPPQARTDLRASIDKARAADPTAFHDVRDLVEAIGLLRDPRAMPVLVAVLSREGDFATTRTSAEAVARMDDDEAANVLVSSVSKATGERATAILAGMGACHRAIVARTLSDRLAARPDEAAARHVMKSLGHVGSAWAWKTLADRREEAASRETAARALLSSYVYYTGEARDAAAKALLVVDDSHTDALIEAARREAAADVAVALDELARRFAQNPTR